MRNGRQIKTCPRCGMKNLLSQYKCDECGLVFSKLQHASNKEAKRNLLKRQKDKIVYTKDFPSDLKYYKVLLLAIFLGYAGVHNVYVGKFIKGSIMAILFCTLLICMCFPYEVYGSFYNIFYFPVGISVFVWLYDIAMLLLRKFKVPVSIKLPVEVD